MFQDSLMESVAHHSTLRGRNMLMGFGLQFAALSVLVVYPLLHPEALPAVFRGAPTPIISAPNPEPVRANAASAPNSGAPTVSMRPLVQPSSVPRNVSAGPDTAPPSVFTIGNSCQAGCIPVGVPTINNAQPVLAQKPAHLIVSHLQAGQIISQVQPVYPVIAKATHIQGAVVLHAVIGRNGDLENLQVVSSASPLLNDAALRAVSQWKFRPYVLNGSPIEVETEIMVNFKLAE